MRSSGELPCIRGALRILNRFYGELPAVEFGPVKLDALRDEMAKPQKRKAWRKVPDAKTGKPERKLVEVERAGWSRKFINAQVNRIRRMFKWAASRELLPASVHAQLATLPGLQKGKTSARETSPVKPAEEAAVARAVTFLPPPVKAIIELCEATGMRPGEARVMRTGDIDRSVNPWVYRPRYHKTEHRGEDHRRVIMLGPRAQQILTPMLKLDPAAYLFRPPIRSHGSTSSARPRAKRP
jgi:integrase